MAVEFTKAGERKVEEFIGDVLDTYKQGRVGRSGATSAIARAMHFAAHDDARLGVLMQNWLNGTARQPLP